jgi:hypothetical protein
VVNVRPGIFFDIIYVKINPFKVLKGRYSKWLNLQRARNIESTTYERMLCITEKFQTIEKNVIINSWYKAGLGEKSAKIDSTLKLEIEENLLQGGLISLTYPVFTLL